MLFRSFPVTIRCCWLLVVGCCINHPNIHAQTIDREGYYEPKEDESGNRSTRKTKVWKRKDTTFEKIVMNYRKDVEMQEGIEKQINPLDIQRESKLST